MVIENTREVSDGNTLQEKCSASTNWCAQFILEWQF